MFFSTWVVALLLLQSTVPTDTAGKVSVGGFDWLQHVMTLVAVIVGGALTIIGQHILEGRRVKEKYKSDLYSKRLEIYQEGFKFAFRLFNSSVGTDAACDQRKSLSEELENWREDNWLYLDNDTNGAAQMLSAAGWHMKSLHEVNDTYHKLVECIENEMGVKHLDIPLRRTT